MLYFIIKKIPPYNTLFVVTLKHTLPLGQCYNKSKMNSRPFAEKKIGLRYFHTFLLVTFSCQSCIFFFPSFPIVLLFHFIGTVSIEQLQINLNYSGSQLKALRFQIKK